MFSGVPVIKRILSGLRAPRGFGLQGTPRSSVLSIIHNTIYLPRLFHLVFKAIEKKLNALLLSFSSLPAA